MQHRSGNNSRRLERIGWGGAAWQRGRETGETVRLRGCTGREREEGKRGPLLVGYSNGGVAAVQRCISCSSALPQDEGAAKKIGNGSWVREKKNRKFKTHHTRISLAWGFDHLVGPEFVRPSRR